MEARKLELSPYYRPMIRLTIVAVLVLGLVACGSMSVSPDWSTEQPSPSVEPTPTAGLEVVDRQWPIAITVYQSIGDPRVLSVSVGGARRGASYSTNWEVAPAGVRSTGTWSHQ